MKTSFEYIEFEKYEDTGKTTKWRCINKSGQYSLGKISWYAGWRQYTFSPNHDTVYSKGCLSDIVFFINQLMEERK